MNNLFTLKQKAIILLALFCAFASDAQDVTTFTGISGAGTPDIPSTVPLMNATFSEPYGITVDPGGRTWIVERSSSRIRVVYGTSVIVRAGSPSGLSGNTNAAGINAMFNYPQSVVSSSTGVLFIADAGNNCIRTVTAFTTQGQSQMVSDFAGKNGPGAANQGFVNDTATKARFKSPAGLAIDKNNNLYVADAGNNAIRKIDPEGVVTTVAGNGTAGFADGAAATAKFIQPVALTMMGDNSLLIVDAGNKRIRKLDLTTMIVSTFAGDGDNDFDDGTLASASFVSPGGIAYDDSTGYAYVTDGGQGSTIRIITSDSVKTYAGKAGEYGATNGTLADARFSNPVGITLNGGYLYVCDVDSNMIRKIIAASKPSPPVGLTNLNHVSEIRLFPNPTRGLIHIESLEPVNEVRIFNLLGERLHPTQTESETIDISGFDKGLYFVTIQTHSGIKTYKTELIP